MGGAGGWRALFKVLVKVLAKVQPLAATCALGALSGTKGHKNGPWGDRTHDLRVISTTL